MSASRWVALLTLAALAACGSTAERSAIEVGAPPGLGPTIAPGDLPGHGITAVAGAGEEEGTRTAGDPQDEVEPASAPVTPAVAASSAAGPPLRIGFVAIREQRVDFLALRIDIPDMKATIRAVVDEINATGGIAGRPVEAVVHEIEVAATPGAAQTIHEEACVRLTEDEGVFLVISLDSNGVAAAGCYASHRTPYLDYTGADDTVLRQRHPWILPSPLPSLDTIATMLVESLDRQGFFDAPVGVWIYDNPEQRRSAERTLLPAIEEAGGDVVATFTGLNGSGASAVLRFRAAGAERVVIWDFGVTWVELATAASNQGYRPRWAVQSTLGPQASAEAVPEDQRSGTVGAGWAPGADVPDDALPLTDAERRCFEVVGRRASVRLTSRSTEHGALALMTCELVAIVRAALEQVPGGMVEPEQVWSLVAALGDRAPVVTPPQPWFAADRFDGGRRYADLAFDDACECFAYRSGWQVVR